MVKYSFHKKALEEKGVKFSDIRFGYSDIQFGYSNFLTNRDINFSWQWLILLYNKKGGGRQN